MVAVISPVGCKIEGDREAFLTGREVAAIEGVGVLCRRETGILAHRPGPLRIHGRVGTTAKRRETGIVVEEVEALGVSRRIGFGEIDALGRFQLALVRRRRRLRV